MRLSDYIDTKVFLIALGIGMFFAYIYVPELIIVYKYPTPFNANQIIYRDTSGTCYKYDVKEIKCPANKNNIKNIPISHQD